MHYLRKFLDCLFATFVVLLTAHHVVAQEEPFQQAENEPPTEEEQQEAPEEPVVFDATWRQPLSSRNQFPFALQFVYMTPDRAGTLPSGENAVEVRLDYSNIISGQETDADRMLLDLEYLRTRIGYRRGLPNGMELGVSIPFYAYYGGFLDGFVGGFHEFFGLPNFLRGQVENGLTQAQFREGEMTRFDLNESFNAVGDLSVHFKKTLFTRDHWTFAARTKLKLPSGDSEHFGGSGATDVGIGAAVDRVTSKWGLYANANYHFVGQPDRFDARDFFSFMVGIDYRWKPRLTLHMQYDNVRPFVDGDLPIFNEAAQQLALGARWRYSDRFRYEWAFVEDFSDVSPDFTVSFQVGIHWQRNHESDEN